LISLECTKEIQAPHHHGKEKRFLAFLYLKGFYEKHKVDLHLDTVRVGGKVS